MWRGFPVNLSTNSAEEPKDLEVSPSQEFIDFYNSYFGPFFEESLGFELLDIIEDFDNIYDSTLACREEYEFEKNFLY